MPYFKNVWFEMFTMYTMSHVVGMNIVMKSSLTRKKTEHLSVLRLSAQVQILSFILQNKCIDIA